jgi:hypothetical protein
MLYTEKGIDNNTPPHTQCAAIDIRTSGPKIFAPRGSSLVKFKFAKFKQVATYIEPALSRT